MIFSLVLLLGPSTTPKSVQKGILLILTHNRYRRVAFITGVVEVDSSFICDLFWVVAVEK